MVSNQPEKQAQAASSQPSEPELAVHSDILNKPLSSAELPSLSLDGIRSKHDKIGVIAIDGAAGTGKGTLAKNLSILLDVPVLDTGAIYRSLAYVLIEKGVQIGDSESLLEELDQILPTFADNFKYSSYEGEARVSYRDMDLTDLIRSGPVSMMASFCSSFSKVRDALLSIQREIASKEERGMIVEGRDIGTRVFPDSKVKIFLDGEPLVRAHWRYQQLLQKHDAAGHPIESRPKLETVIADFLSRDLYDRTREIDPLPFEPPTGYSAIQITGDDENSTRSGILSEKEVALIAFNIIEEKLDALNQH